MAMKSILSGLFSGIGQQFTPQLEAAQNAADNLTLAFEVLIGEGAVVILLLGILIWRQK
jgi:hypothetical protein